MTLIDLSALSAGLGLPGPLARGEVRLQRWAGSGSPVIVEGENVVFPADVRVEIIDGEPQRPLEVEPTDGTFCYRLIVSDARTGRQLEWYVAVPAVVSVPVGDLVQVDPKTFEPTGEVVAAWEAAITTVEADRVRAEAVSAEAVASAEAAGVSAAEAEGDASDAATSATDALAARNEAVTAAGTAAAAASDAETARAGAVVAKGAAESASTSAAASETVATDASSAAETARAGAQVAETSATTAQAAAEEAATVATTARTGAENARDTAQETADGIPAAVAVAIAAQAGKIVQGVGMPTGVVSAPPGTIYADTAATNGASIWRKVSGTGSTGWVVVDGDTGVRQVVDSLMNGWTRISPSYGPFLHRVGSRVSYDGYLSRSAATALAFTDVPEGFRPSKRAYGHAFPATTQQGGTTIQAVGSELQMTYYASLSVTGWFVHISWDTSDPWPVTLPGTPA